MNEDNERTLKYKVISGLFWKFGERISSQLITLIVSIVLARILSPTEYGLIALVLVFITIADVFVSSGLGSALIQKKNADSLDFSSVFFINLGFSIVLYAILFFIAPVVAAFYDNALLCPVFRVLALRIPIAAVNSVQQAYVSRNMMFRRFFWSSLWGAIFSGIVGIVMALIGYGIWALVAQYLVNVAVNTIVLWFTVKWRPIMACSFKRAKGLVSYGWKLLVSGLLDTGYNQLRSLLIGKLYTSEDLAFYNQGEKFPMVIATNVNSSISAVLFPAMSQYQDDYERVKQITRRSIQVGSYVMWPLMIGLAAVSESFVKVLLTDKWLPCVPYLCIFCFTYGLWPIHTANLQALNAIGRSDLFLKLEIIKKTLGLIVLFITVSYGPLVIASGLIVTSILSTFINSAPNSRILGYKYNEQFRDMLPSFLLSLFMGIIVYFIKFIGLSSIITLILQIVTGVIVYIFVSKILHFGSFNYVMKTIKSVKDK